jgi:hypothetical protein
MTFPGASATFQALLALSQALMAQLKEILPVNAPAMAKNVGKNHGNMVVEPTKVGIE